MLRIRQALSAAPAVLALALLFAGPYVIRLMNEVFRLTGGNNFDPIPGAILAVLTFPFLLTMLLVSVLLGQVHTLVLAGVLTMAVCGWVLLRRRAGTFTRALAVLTIAGVVAFPFVFQKPVHTGWLEEQGYTVYAIPTQPTILEAAVDGLVDQLDGKGCHYDILGWSATNQLYYRADCRFGPDTIWRYDPQQSAPASPVVEVTEPLVTQAENLLLNEMYEPTDHRSPDGRWIATPWGKFFYGPENVLIVSETGS